MSSLSLPSAKPRKTALQRAIELRESGVLEQNREAWRR